MGMTEEEFNNDEWIGRERVPDSLRFMADAIIRDMHLGVTDVKIGGSAKETDGFGRSINFLTKSPHSTMNPHARGVVAPTVPVLNRDYVCSMSIVCPGKIASEIVGNVLLAIAERRATTVANVERCKNPDGVRIGFWRDSVDRGHVAVMYAILGYIPIPGQGPEAGNVSVSERRGNGDDCDTTSSPLTDILSRLESIQDELVSVAQDVAAGAEETRKVHLVLLGLISNIPGVSGKTGGTQGVGTTVDAETITPARLTIPGQRHGQDDADDAGTPPQ